MKLPARQIVVTDSAIGKGLDIALTLAIFFGIGFGLDRWLGTTPLFMIVLSVAAAVGLMARTWSRYESSMQQHEAERREMAKARR